MAETVLEKTSVNAIFVAGNDFNVEYLMQSRNVDKSNHPRKDLFQPGNYPFYWPGICCVWGGSIEPGETYLEGILRETNEELHFNISKEQIASSDLRVYEWNKCTKDLWSELNEFFHGNLESFFGPALNSIIPNSVLGKDRSAFEERYGKFGTYFDWMKGREDAYLIVDFDKPFDATDYEGVGATWLPHHVVRSLVSSPVDKFAILDDMMIRAKAGKMLIEPPEVKKKQIAVDDNPLAEFKYTLSDEYRNPITFFYNRRKLENRVDGLDGNNFLNKVAKTFNQENFDNVMEDEINSRIKGTYIYRMRDGKLRRERLYEQNGEFYTLYNNKPTEGEYSNKIKNAIKKFVKNQCTKLKTIT